MILAAIRWHSVKPVVETPFLSFGGGARNKLKEVRGIIVVADAGLLLLLSMISRDHAELKTGYPTPPPLLP